MTILDISNTEPCGLCLNGKAKQTLKVQYENTDEQLISMSICVPHLKLLLLALNGPRHDGQRDAPENIGSSAIAATREAP